MTEKVVALRRGPSLADIPGMLRNLADDVEAGVYGEVPSVLVLMPRSGDYPHAFGFGDQDGEHHPIVTMEIAKVWFATRQVAR